MSGYMLGNRSRERATATPVAALMAGVLWVGLGWLGCQQPPKTLASKCVDDWPAARSFTPADSLDVEPEIVWQARVTGSPTSANMLWNGRHVAFTANARLYALDSSGAMMVRRPSAGLEGLGSGAVDAEGNYYVVGASVYSFDPDGELRWIVPLSSYSDKAGWESPRATGRLVLAPDGSLYFGASDGYLYGVDIRDGSLRWRSKVSDPASGQRAPVVVAGVGNAIMGISRTGTWQPGLWNRETGEAMAFFSSQDGERYGRMIGARIGIVTERFEDRGGAYPWMQITALDRCSRPRFTLTAERPQWPVLIGPGDQLYVVERDDVEGSPTFVSVYSPDGVRVKGPVAMAIPWAIGADGTIYGVACDTPGVDGPSRLHAYNAELEEQWMLPLGDSCPTAGPIIDDSGKLYFVWYRDLASEVVTVQTTSPGLADTAWPIRRHDVRGAGWVE